MKKTLSLLLALCFLLSLPLGGIAEDAARYAPEDIDLDLADLSGTLVYAQIYQMANEPENYIDKVIRLSGWYEVFQDSSTGLVYTSCYIPDASACCAQGIEFVWAGDHAYPDDYPEPGTGLIVTGRFETYVEDGWMYMHLVDAEVVWLPEAY